MDRARVFTVKNDIFELPALSESIHDWLDSFSPSSKLLFTADLTIEEVLTNIIKYSYDDSVAAGNCTISLSLSVDDDTLTMIFVDDGVAFDPIATSCAVCEASLEERPIGGLGLHLVKEMSDSLSYERLDGKNIFTVKIKDQFN